MNYKKTIILVSTLLFLLTGIFLYRESKKEKVVILDETIFVGDPKEVIRRLDLTEDQIRRIGDLNAVFKSDMLQYREKLKPLTERIEGELAKETVELEKVRVLLQLISDIKNERRMEAIRHRIAIESLLTENQKRRLTVRHSYEAL